MDKSDIYFNHFALGEARLGMTVSSSVRAPEPYNPFRFHDPATGCLYVVDSQPSIGKSSYMALITNEFLNSNKER